MNGIIGQTVGFLCLYSHVRIIRELKSLADKNGLAGFYFFDVLVDGAVKGFGKS